MKILDKYVAKNFFIGYLISFFVLIGMRIFIDLFVNLDEFVEHTELSGGEVFMNIIRFYRNQAALYFRDFSGMITVVAAVFSLGKMTRNNELIAIMASGVSLKRVIAPIIVIAIILTGALVIDQEILIPNLADRLARDHDELPGQEKYKIWYMEDQNDNLLCTENYDEQTKTMLNPTVVIRKQTGPYQWDTTGWIVADKASYNSSKNRWDLTNGRFISIRKKKNDSRQLYEPETIGFYETDITPEQIPQRRQERYLSYLNLPQLNRLAKQGKDLAEIYAQKHFRITEPIINLIMLLVALPILVCREPRSMKSAVFISFIVTLGCFVTTFISKMVASETIFNQVRPELWAWLPVFAFLPVALLEIDAMKT